MSSRVRRSNPFWAPAQKGLFFEVVRRNRSGN
jgi:hypothetical protein